MNVRDDITAFEPGKTFWLDRQTGEFIDEAEYRRRYPEAKKVFGSFVIESVDRENRTVTVRGEDNVD